MKKLLLFCLFAASFLALQAVNTIVRKPFIEGRGLRGWQIDSIQICDTATFVYGHFGLGKGTYSSGDLNNYIEIPATGKQYKQKGLLGIPMAPERVEGKGQQVSFTQIFSPIDPDARSINITSADFDGTDAAWYGVWLSPKPSVFPQQMSKLSGNWFAANTVWKAGFYDRKVYWNNLFWNFKILKNAGKTATLELTNKKAKLKLNLTLNNDSSLSIVEGSKKLSLHKTAVYKVSDNSELRTDFAPNDSLTVSGYYQVANPVFSKKAVLFLSDIISSKQLIYPVSVAEDGTFSTKIPLVNSTKVTFSNQLGPMSPLSEVSFLAEPGNHIVLTYRNEAENAVVFGGDNQRLNNELQAFTTANPFFITERMLRDRRQESWSEFATWRTEKSEKMKSAYSIWKSAHSANQKLDMYMQLYLKYAAVSDLAKMFVSTQAKVEPLEFIPALSDTLFYNNRNAVSLPDYLNMLDVVGSLPRKSASNITVDDFVGYLKENSSPTAAELKLFVEADASQKNIKSKEDFDNYKKFIAENKLKLDSLTKKYQMDIMNFRRLRMEEAKKKYALPAGFGNDLAKVREIGNILAPEESTIPAEHLSTMLAGIKNQDLVSLLTKRNDAFSKKLEALKTAKLPQGVNTYTLPDDTKDLLGAIAQKYKGKVVYVDYWATWCGPCKREMPYSELRKADFKGKDVVFVYITGASSPELTWKKMITEIPGEHYKLTETQWKTICEKYQITGIPHYMLIDKNGKTVQENAPRPSSDTELKNAINDLLK